MSLGVLDLFRPRRNVPKMRKQPRKTTRPGPPERIIYPSFLSTQDDPPPPYTSESHAYFGPSKMNQTDSKNAELPAPLADPTLPSEINFITPPNATKLSCQEEQLRRYLIEIVAYALDANFDELNTALYKQSITYHTNTILSSAERAELLHLSRLIQELCGKTRSNQANTMKRTDMMQVYTAVSYPAMWIGLGEDALDLVASYADYAEDANVENARRSKTLLAHWACNQNRTNGERDMKASLNSCTRAIEKISFPNGNVQCVLRRALEKYQQESGIEPVEYGSICYPVREGYSDLYTLMRGSWRTEEDQIVF
ncbi:hypothetical protein PTTW11_00947 [Pyrenophora teres f. teres]|uniref:Uncharacterized protein n=1 Tax=Pyrenophora teres f. teres TaxID=97479 RepID=A0A6S6VDB3_9PLEO|nr:hypothetical protein PTTW11_00947 [Pyrenophora teres f. teres]